LILHTGEEIGNIHPIEAVPTDLEGAVPTVVMVVEDVAMAGE